MSILLFVLGLLDIFGSIFIFFNLVGVGYGFYFLWIIAIIHLVKGLYSLAVGSLFAAFTDIASAFILFLSYFSVPMYYVLGTVIGVLLLIKGIQSIIPFASEMIRA